MRLLRIHKTILQTTHLLWLKANKILKPFDTALSFYKFYSIYVKVTHKEDRLGKNESKEVIETFFGKIVDKTINTGLPVLLPEGLGFVRISKNCKECREVIDGKSVTMYKDEDLPFEQSSIYSLRIGEVPRIQRKVEIRYPLSIMNVRSAYTKILNKIKEDPSIVNNYYR